jgi:hypothetical protein
VRFLPQCLGWYDEESRWKPRFPEQQIAIILKQADDIIGIEGFYRKAGISQ